MIKGFDGFFVPVLCPRFLKCILFCDKTRYRQVLSVRMDYLRKSHIIVICFKIWEA